MGDPSQGWAALTRDLGTYRTEGDRRPEIVACETPRNVKRRIPIRTSGCVSGFTLLLLT